MDVNWSPDDSSSFVRFEDESEVDQNADTQIMLHDRPTRRNGFGIDDSDFEALIEILGSDGDRQNADVGRRETRVEAEATGNQQSARSQQEHDHHFEDNGVLVARESVGTNEADTHASKGDVVCSPSRKVQKPMKRPVRTETGRVNHPSVVSSPETAANPVLRPVPAHERSHQSASPCRTSIHGPARLERQTPTARSPRPRPRANLGFTQSKQELGSSIIDAKDQLADLRGRLQVLKSEVKEFAPLLYRKAFDAGDLDTQRPTSNEDEQSPQRRQYSNAKGKGRAVAHSELSNGPRRSSEVDLISSLTEDEAKCALINICQTLRINPKDPASSSMQDQTHDLLVPPSNLSDIVRALNLVSDLDELVWRGRNLQAGPSRAHPAYDIYDEENIRALLDHVRLWERTARSRPRRPTVNNKSFEFFID
ncbi:hypothetical protein ACEPAG_1438 [Sanghuangporus baumii]